MARYAAETAATHVADIDVNEVAQSVYASAMFKSAFMPGVSSFRAPSRIGLLVQQGSKTWSTMDFDAVALGGQDETVYNPTGRTFTAVGHGVDTVVGQYANIDGSTSGKDLVQQIVDETSLDYARYFDSLCAALYTESPAANDVGTSTGPLSAAVIDEAISNLLAAGAPEPFNLVIRTNKIPELMQIPHMRDRAVRGVAGAGGIDGPNLQRNNSALLVKGYGGILDVYHTPEIDVSTGTHNVMYAVGDGTNGAIANPWVPLKLPNGFAPGKIWLEVGWNPQARAVEVMASTIEVALGSVFTSSTNLWIADVLTGPAS